MLGPLALHRRLPSRRCRLSLAAAFGLGVALDLAWVLVGCPAATIVY